jgi:hypothetical protein
MIAALPPFAAADIERAFERMCNFDFPVRARPLATAVREAPEDPLPYAAALGCAFVLRTGPQGHSARAC